MNLSLINKVKYSPLLYSCYYYIGSVAIKLLNLFIKPSFNNILFISYGGRKFDDSPKAIYEALLKDNRFKNKKLIWSFQNPERYSIKRGKKIKTDSIRYYFNLLKSGVWITNSGVERGLFIPKGNRLYINTWHGTPIKKMGSDISSDNTAFKSKSQESTVDIMLAQTQYDIEIFSRVFGIKAEKFRITGLPRNDELVNNNHTEYISKIKKKLNIPKSKKVILYAPTFREFQKDKGGNCIFNIPIDLIQWRSTLGEEYILLVRAHYEVAKVLGTEDNDFVRNVSHYESLNDLMLASDILISDYSSIFFDYAILKRPMIAYCYDYEKYAENRGMYFDIREILDSYVDNEIDLLNMLNQKDFSKQIESTIKFKRQFGIEVGRASSKVLDIIVNFQRDYGY